MVARDLISNTFRGMSSSAVDFNSEVIRKNKSFREGSLPDNEAPLLVMSTKTRGDKNGDYCGVYNRSIKTQEGQTDNGPTDAPRKNPCGKGKSKLYNINKKQLRYEESEW